MDDSQKLLVDYVKNGSESAFRELVTRYINLVHSTAIRLADGDAHLAQDITQTVFVDLARKAHTLPPQVMLGGWLHRDACFAARTTMRGERRRHFRERQAVAMNLPEDHTAANLALVAPILDEAIDQLEADDRTAILLRFFERLEFRAVGEAMGCSEDAARMRVTRTLEKLHTLLKNRGVAFSATVLGAALAAEAVTAAPLGLAVTVAGTALASVAAGGVTATLLKFMAMTKFKMAIVSAIAVAALAVPVIMQQQTIRALRQKNDGLKQQVAQIAPLQEQLAHTSQDAVNAGGGSLAEAQVRDLARLRAEVVRLRTQTNELAEARQEIKTLKQRAAAAGIHTGPVAVASPVSDDLLTAGLRDTYKLPADVEACLNNLHLIDLAKQRWALENKKPSTATPTMDDLRPYLGHDSNAEIPTCLDGGVYNIGTVGEKPTCSIPGHVLP